MRPSGTEDPEECQKQTIVEKRIHKRTRIERNSRPGAKGLKRQPVGVPFLSLSQPLGVGNWHITIDKNIIRER